MFEKNREKSKKEENYKNNPEEAIDQYLSSGKNDQIKDLLDDLCKLFLPNHDRPTDKSLQIIEDCLNDPNSCDATREIILARITKNYPIYNNVDNNGYHGTFRSLRLSEQFSYGDNFRRDNKAQVFE